MNSALELHDSKVVTIRMSGGALHVVFESAYVHRSAGQPGTDAGSGYAQPAEMVFSDAQYSESAGPCTGAISDGEISTEGAKFENVVPLPFSASGTCRPQLRSLQAACSKLPERASHAFQQARRASWRHMTANNAFERTVRRGGPRLAAAWATWPAAQLGRYAS